MSTPKYFLQVEKLVRYDDPIAPVDGVAVTKFMLYDMDGDNSEYAATERYRALNIEVNQMFQEKKTVLDDFKVYADIDFNPSDDVRYCVENYQLLSVSADGKRALYSKPLPSSDRCIYESLDEYIVISKEGYKSIVSESQMHSQSYILGFTENLRGYYYAERGEGVDISDSTYSYVNIQTEEKIEFDFPNKKHGIANVLSCDDFNDQYAYLDENTIVIKRLRTNEITNEIDVPNEYKGINFLQFYSNGILQLYSYGAQKCYQLDVSTGKLLNSYNEQTVTVSPNGKYIAYAEKREGNTYLTVKNMKTDEIAIDEIEGFSIVSWIPSLDTN